MSPSLQVVFGAGQVGATLATLLRERGLPVRVVRRSTQTAHAGVELQCGDAADPAFCREAARGASVLYHCMNPPYSAAAWTELLPKYMENLITAAASTGARLVVLDNLYMLGRPEGRALDEDSPVHPCSRKGEIRARVAEQLFRAHREGRVQAVCGRASDFYGPGGRLSSLGDWFWPAALAGKTARLPFDPAMPHSWHYIPDVASGLLQLGLAEEDVCGKPWMLPCAPACAFQDLLTGLEQALGRPLSAARVPGWLLRGLALVLPMMRELKEMGYQWDEPFVVDDRRFRTRFGLSPTEPGPALRATAAWAVAQYGAR